MWILWFAAAQAACGSLPDLTVCAEGCDLTELADALSVAEDGDEVCVQGTNRFTEPLVFRGPGSVVIATDEQGVVTLDDMGDAPQLTVSGGQLEVRDVVFAPSASQRGVFVDGGVAVLASVELSNHQAALPGSALRVEGGGEARLVGVFASGNGHPDQDGGHVSVTDGIVVISDSRFEGGVARHGGMVHASGTSSLVVEDATFAASHAEEDGGALWVGEQATLSVSGLTVTGSSADRGGVLYLQGADQAVIRRTFLCDNHARLGGAVYADEGSDDLQVQGNVWVDNQATTDGGALWLGSAERGELTNNHFVGNVATGGGAVLTRGQGLQFRNNLVQGNAPDAVRDLGTGLQVGHNAWFDNGTGLVSSAVYVDAQLEGPFVGYDVGACLLGQHTPGGSAAIDRGDPRYGPDPDGDVLVDIGGFGGLYGMFVDADGDGAVGRDCDDTDPTVGPGAVEDCTTVDRNCNGLARDGFGADEYFVDLDGDGFGEGEGQPACAPGDLPDLEGGTWVSSGGDCDEADPRVNPGADEVCDGIDNDCDFSVDQGARDAERRYVDVDGDGFGDASSVMDACDPPAVYSALNGDDCDDSDPDVGDCSASNASCGCRAAPGAAWSPWGMLVLGLGWRRRRP